jgi:hypothetical protein
VTAAEVGRSLLAAAVAALTDPPARRLFTGQPGAPSGGPESICSGPLVAEFTLRVLRCFPTSTTQADSDPTAVGAAADQLVGDAEALRVALRDWQPRDDMSLGDVWVGDVVGFRPQGLAHAIAVTVHVAT